MFWAVSSVGGAFWAVFGVCGAFWAVSRLGVTLVAVSRGGGIFFWRKRFSGGIFFGDKQYGGIDLAVGDFSFFGGIDLCGNHQNTVAAHQTGKNTEDHPGICVFMLVPLYVP